MSPYKYSYEDIHEVSEELSSMEISLRPEQMEWTEEVSEELSSMEIRSPMCADVEIEMRFRRT